MSVCSRIQRTCLAGVLLSGLGPLLVPGQAENNAAMVVAYAEALQPHATLEFGGESIPAEFSENPFSLFLIYNPGSTAVFDWVLCISKDRFNRWEHLSGQSEWRGEDHEDYRFFTRGDGTVLKSNPVVEGILDHQKRNDRPMVSAGLLPGWNSALKDLYANQDSRDLVFSNLWPQLEAHFEEYDPYLLWWIQEFTSVESLQWTFQPSLRGGRSSLEIDVTPGTRLSRLFNQKSKLDASVLGYVPKGVPNLVYGSVDPVSTNNYLNYLFKGTNLVVHAPFKEIRASLDALDSGVFDRWKGNWVKWDSPESESSALLIGGGFLPTDLSEIFDVLSKLDISSLGFGLELDANNSIAGFTRIRSVDVVRDRGTGSGATPKPNRYYVAIASNGLVVTQTESDMFELIFRLNSRKPLKNSSESLATVNPKLAILTMGAGGSSGTVQLVDGKLIYNQVGTSRSLDRVLTWIVNKAHP